MASVLCDIVRFLGWSSVQFAAIAAVALPVLAATRASGRVALRTLTLVAALPLLSLLSEQLPERPVRVIPASFPVAIGIERDLAQPPGSSATVAKARASDASLDKAEVSPGSPATVASAADAPVSAAPARAPASAPPPHRSHIRVPAALGSLWLAVVAVLAVRIVRRWLALRTVLRSAVPVTGPEACALVEDCVRRAGLARRPRVLVSAACGVPFVTGLARPCIVMPSRLLGEKLRLALLHEMAHVRYRDHLWIVPELFVRTLYFFHPFVHRVLNRLYEEREHRCDRLVVGLLGRRATYAEFLLDEVRRASERPRGFPVLALRGDRKAVARRVGRILEGGESTMKRTMSERLTVGAVALWLALVLSCGTTNVAVGQEGAAPGAQAGALDHINASKTDTPGLYQVLPVFEKLTEVAVIRRGGPYGKEHEVILKPGEGYAFDPATGSLKVIPPVDDEKQMVVVRGARATPWAWQAGEPFKRGSVRVLLGDQEGKRGVDFDVDEAKGRIRFLKPELCDKEKPYFIAYDFPDDPKKPNVGRCGSIGNHPDRDAVHRFLGVPEVPPAAGGMHKSTAGEMSRSIGTNAAATDDRRRWTITPLLESESVRVAVLKRGEPTNLRWLERSTDYIYDEAATTIAFLRDIAVDEKTELLFVQGIPRDRHVFFAHRALKEGEVSVTVEGRTLVEGTGFSVDYKTGKITVHDEAITKAGAAFQINAAGWAYGQTCGS